MKKQSKRCLLLSTLLLIGLVSCQTNPTSSSTPSSSLTPSTSSSSSTS